jgi:flagellar motor switch protein FliN/FliY
MSGESDIIGQSEIEELLKQAQGAAQQPPTSAPIAPAEYSPVRADDIDSLLTGGSTAPKESSEILTGTIFGSGTGTATRKAAGSSTSSQQTGDDIAYLLEQAEAAVASVNSPNPTPESLTPFHFKDFAGSPASQERATLDLLGDVELDLKIELGRTNMYLEDVLKLRRGSVVALDKLAGDPVDVYVNGRLIARGEVLVLNDNFCVRVAELVTGDDTK